MACDCVALNWAIVIGGIVAAIGTICATVLRFQKGEHKAYRK